MVLCPRFQLKLLDGNELLLFLSKLTLVVLVLIDLIPYHGIVLPLFENARFCELNALVLDGFLQAAQFHGSLMLDLLLMLLLRDSISQRLFRL